MTRSFHIRPIDGLRGIAALGVVLFHLRPTYLFWLWSMVDLFFVISGLVITLQLLKPAGLGVGAMRAFWMRRVLRIFPLYYFSLFLAIGVEWTFLELGLIQGGRHEPLWPFFVFLQFTDLYWPGSGSAEFSFPRYFLPSWSLAAEEQFYLVWPLLLLALRRRAAALGMVCLMLFVAGLVMRLADFSPYLLLSRVDGLAAGSLLALILHRLGGSQAGQTGSSRLPGIMLARTTYLLPVALGGLLVAPLLVLGYAATVTKAKVDTAYASVAVTGFILIFTSLIAWVTLRPRGFMGRVLSHPVMSYLGSISFSVYLLHVPMRAMYLALLRLHDIDRSLLTDVVYVAAVIAAAHLTRNLIERPFERLKHRYPMEPRPLEPVVPPSSPCPEGAYRV